MNFQKILIAVDSEPVAAHAAEVGSELARSLGAAVALIYAVDPTFAAAPESGISAYELITQAEQEGKRLLAGFPRAPVAASIHVGVC